jgi:peptide/nickel transport system substrate-binding protein
VKIALTAAPVSLDPHLHADTVSESVLRNIFEGLTALDASMRVRPALAERWESLDELTWAFTIRDGVRFHDGRLLTAADAAFSIQRLLTHPRGASSAYLANISEVEALDARTLRIETRRSYPILPAKLALARILPVGTPESIPAPIGTGPYRLKAYEPGRRVELEAFEGYWQRPARLTPVHFVVIEDEAVAVSRLLAGDVDVVRDLAGAQASRVLASDCCRLDTSLGSEVVLLSLSTARPPLSDRRVRRALTLAFDRTALVQQMLGGRGRPAGQFVSQHVFGYAPDLEPVAQDTQKARQLLTEAGYPDGVELELEHQAGTDPGPIVVQPRAAGIRLKPIPRAWGELMERLMRGRVSLFLGRLVCPTGDASDVLDTMLHTRQEGFGSLNVFGYANPEVDACIEASVTPDTLERQERLQQCMRLASQDLTMIALFAPDVLIGARRGLRVEARMDGVLDAYAMSLGTESEPR